MATLKERLKDSLKDNDKNSYESISYRASPKMVAMIEIMSIIMKNPVSSLLTDDITESLVEILLSDNSNIELIKSLYNEDKDILSGGCLSVLVKNQIIKVEYEIGDLDL